ncbi:MAG: hypothetical protein LQ343_003477 [Gyalolechia ehrenbergii]|nr:MAG: hypothetical protein LQ343_003477 [Gyalolechia ehrenbergii]
MAVPNAPMQTKTGSNLQSGHCSRTCTIALATIIPVVFLVLIFPIAFMVWGKPYLEKRQRRREEEDAARRKLGDEDIVMGGNDVSNFDGEVLRRGEERREEIEKEKEEEKEKKETKREVRRERRVEEGHEHDHDLAMIQVRV